MHRWIQADTKGIAVIRKNDSNKHYLDYVFDIQDTKPVQGAKNPYLWGMNAEHQEAIFVRLEPKYGVSNSVADGIDIAQYLVSVSNRIVAETYHSYFLNIKNEAFSNGLDEAEIQELERPFQDVITASVQFTVLKRCGLEPERYLNCDTLDLISMFAIPSIVHQIGTATSTVSMDLLNEIGRAIKGYEREKYF